MKILCVINHQQWENAIRKDERYSSRQSFKCNGQYLARDAAGWN